MQERASTEKRGLPHFAKNGIIFSEKMIFGMDKLNLKRLLFSFFQATNETWFQILILKLNLNIPFTTSLWIQKASSITGCILADNKHIQNFLNAFIPYIFIYISLKESPPEITTLHTCLSFKKCKSFPTWGIISFFGKAFKSLKYYVILVLQVSGEYSEPYQTSKKNCSAKAVQHFILDVWQSSEYDSERHFINSKGHFTLRVKER